MVKHETAGSPDPTQKEAASEPACLAASPLQAANLANLEGVWHQFGGIKTVLGYHPGCGYVHVCLYCTPLRVVALSKPYL